MNLPPDTRSIRYKILEDYGGANLLYIYLTDVKLHGGLGIHFTMKVIDHQCTLKVTLTPN